MLQPAYARFKFPYPQAWVTIKYPWVAWGGDVEAWNWSAELPKSLTCGQWYVFTLSSHWHLTTFTIFQKPELVSKDYDLIHFLKEWFIALCKCTVIIPKLNWNLSHELKIVTSLYILELTLLYPQPCSYLQVIQAWAHFRQKFVKFSMNGSLF